MLIDLQSGAQFEEETATGLVLVDFWNPTCGPCRLMLPALKELSDLGYTIIKVDSDDWQGLVKRFNVSAIPTLIVLNNGIEVQRWQGIVKPERMVEWLEDFA